VPLPQVDPELLLPGEAPDPLPPPVWPLLGGGLAGWPVPGWLGGGAAV